MRLRRNALREEDAKQKQKEMESLKKFMAKRKPNVIVVGVEDRYFSPFSQLS